MRVITKSPEPLSLTRHRAAAHSDFGNYTAKDDLRQALVTEQRGLCCYCMGRIRPEPASMKIEHWRCQAHYLDEQLNYRNLLGVCLGGDGQPTRRQHCDTRKGDRDLRWNPPIRCIASRPAFVTNLMARSERRTMRIRCPARNRLKSQSPCPEEQSEERSRCRSRLVEA